MSLNVTLDPLAPVREAFIRVLDNAGALDTNDSDRPRLVRERATIGLVAVGMSDLPTIRETADAIDELLGCDAQALTGEAAEQCRNETQRIKNLISAAHGTASD